jgi:hypothetical protein
VSAYRSTSPHFTAASQEMEAELQATEGFDTLDLKEAKALLNSLA